ncbi:MAG: hypothetical protein GX383_10565 [Clostridium sp.]|nr:hypothetical protein [Clostridium sp.]
MSDKEKLSIGKELTDEELMEMTGGSSFRIACQKNYSFKPSLPGEVVLKYGVKPNPQPLYGIDPIAQPLYGIDPIAEPLYGVEPIMRPLYGIEPGK